VFHFRTCREVITKSAAASPLHEPELLRSARSRRASLPRRHTARAEHRAMPGTLPASPRKSSSFAVHAPALTAAPAARAGPLRPSTRRGLENNEPDGYRRGSYRIATAPEPNSSRLTSFKLACFAYCHSHRKSASVGE
jgi:hypothetical protein